MRSLKFPRGSLEKRADPLQRPGIMLIVIGWEDGWRYAIRCSGPGSC
jgi:hypothetical protein